MNEKLEKKKEDQKKKENADKIVAILGIPGLRKKLLEEDELLEQLKTKFLKDTSGMKKEELETHKKEIKK